MANICSTCHATMDDNTRYCTNCGAEMPAAPVDVDYRPAGQDTAGAYTPEYIDTPTAQYGDYSQPAHSGQPQGDGAYTSAYGQQSDAPPVYAAPVQDSGYSQYGQSTAQAAPPPYGTEAPPHPDSPYAPVKMGTWVGINVLMCIPVVNLILLIVWACGGSKKVNLKNYARGHLVVMGIQVVLGILATIALVAVFHELAYEYGDMWRYFDYMNI